MAGKNFIKTAVTSFANSLRRILGIPFIIQEQRNQLKELSSTVTRSLETIERLNRSNERLMQRLSSIVEYSLVQSDTVRTSDLFKTCQSIISLLRPCDVAAAKFVRVGRENDGGYVMLDLFSEVEVEAAYSFGISDDVSWDLDMAARQIKVYLYDHTITDIPIHHELFTFRRIGITGSTIGENLISLDKALKLNGHTECKNLVLKMDIEGCEWDVLAAVSSETLQKFVQIVIEFHDLTPLTSREHLRSIFEVLNLINQTHQSVHVHANISESPFWIGCLVLPPLLEVTYVRRSTYEDRFRPNTRIFPTELDMPTFAGQTDLDLGDFQPCPSR